MESTSIVTNTETARLVGTAVEAFTAAGTALQTRLSALDESPTLQIQASLANITEILGNLREDVNTLKGDVNTLKGDVNTLKGYVNTLKGDVSTLKRDVSTLKEDVSTLKGGLERVDRKIESLSFRDLNSRSRIQNASLVDGDAPLIPLVNVTDGQEIMHFPPTSVEIESLPAPKIQTIMGCLGVNPRGTTVGELRRELRVQIGLVRLLKKIGGRKRKVLKITPRKMPFSEQQCKARLELMLLDSNDSRESRTL
ncbi:MAG: hypothetical protein M1814_004453 [Vezdaea aestivalis]|nr:MAG: hypothetical protein M1814_004453 [Vezdaea aestivalis]